ncbi:MAG: iron ABC transporter permease [Pseudomonadota bacterium]
MTAFAEEAATAAMTAAPLADRRRRMGFLVIYVAAAVAVIAFVASVAVGPLDIRMGDVVAILLQPFGVSPRPGITVVEIGVVQSIRLPRALLGAAMGAALGTAGAAMQGFFRNPLAEPGLVGVSAGGALAAVAVIVLGGTVLAGLTASLGTFALPLAAFSGSLIAIFLIYRLSVLEGRVIVATMLLAGVAANALAFSGIGYLTFLADDTQLRDLTFWTLGSLGGATWARILPAGVMLIVAVAGLLTLSRPMNALLLGEDEAMTLGVDVERLKRRAAFMTALGVGAATAVCGIVNFVGLVVPHLVRLMTGPDHRYVLPGSALMGAALVLISDIIARLAVSPAELPLGVITAAIGAPFFFWLLVRDKRRSQLG